MEPRHIVWITLDPDLFSIRYGFGEGAKLGAFLHSFLINTLDAVKISDDQAEYRSDYSAIQVGTYREGDNGKSRRYHVSEGVAAAFYGLAMRLRDNAAEFSKAKEAVGKNLLLQMLKSDVLGEALK